MKHSLLVAFLLALGSLRAQTTFSCTSAATTCPCTYGTSLAEFYSGYHGEVQSFFSTNTPGLTRNDATINYTTDNGWGTIVPPASGSNANPDTYSTRWSGRIYLAAGTYTFWLTSDDGAYFWLGGNALAVNPTTASAFINNGGLHSPTTVSAVGVLTVNCLQDFKLHFGENGGNNRCALEYACTSLGIARQAVPASVFCPCMSTASLPVRLVDFYAVPSKDHVLVKWSTASEKNNALFRVFKSSDGSNWEKLGERSPLPNSGGLKEYALRDPSPHVGTNYYYLEQTDLDGTREVFNTIAVDFSKNSTYIKVFPNPTSGKFTVLANSSWTASDQIRLYNALGKEVSCPVELQEGNRFVVDAAALESGTYTIKIQTAYQVIYRKLVKD